MMYMTTRSLGEILANIGLADSRALVVPEGTKYHATILLSYLVIGLPRDYRENLGTVIYIVACSIPAACIETVCAVIMPSATCTKGCLGIPFSFCIIKSN